MSDRVWKPEEVYEAGAVITETDSGRRFEVVCPQHPRQPPGRCDGERCVWRSGLLPPSVIMDDKDCRVMFRELPPAAVLESAADGSTS